MPGILLSFAYALPACPRGWPTRGCTRPATADAHQQYIAFHDAMSALRTLMKACPARFAAARALSPPLRHDGVAAVDVALL